MSRTAAVGVARDPGENGAVSGPSHAAGPRHPRSILLVEDNVHVGTMYRHAVERIAWSDGLRLDVDTARDGAEALERLRHSPAIALVITDLYMPNVDGFARLEQIRSDPELASIPVLAISSAGPDAREHAIDLGADVCLQKPVNVADLSRAVRQLLGESWP